MYPEGVVSSTRSLLNPHKSGNPPINPQLLAPFEDGTQICRLKEDEFVGRALRTPRVQPPKAKLLYFKLWALHIDSRALPVSTATSTQKLPIGDGIKKVSKPRSIKPGTFVHLHLSSEQDEIVMVLAPERSKESTYYVHAPVRPSIEVEGAYELFVADQSRSKPEAFGEEVPLRYDTKNRYYYIQDQ